MLISVVIPNYNRAGLLRAAIESVRAQSAPVHEIIVVDDGSTDGSVRLIEDMTKADATTRLVQQAHGGANRARNLGVANATGDWIAFLDSDDEWEADKIAQQIAALRTMPDAIASFTGLRQVGGEHDRVFLPIEDPSLMMIRGANVLSTTSTAMIRADVFRSIDGFDPDLPSCQDWDLWFRLRLRGRFAIVREPLVRFNCGPHERISNNFERVLDGHARIFPRLIVGLETDRRSLRRVRATHKLVLSEIYARHGQTRRGVAMAIQSLMARPSRWGARMAAQGLWKLVSDRRGARS